MADGIFWPPLPTFPLSPSPFLPHPSIPPSAPPAGSLVAAEGVSSMVLIWYVKLCVRVGVLFLLTFTSFLLPSLLLSFFLLISPSDLSLFIYLSICLLVWTSVCLCILLYLNFLSCSWILLSTLPVKLSTQFHIK